MLLAEVIAMATFVLVHGAFGSPAELAPVIPFLEALGHRAIAIDLPCSDPAATLDDYARTVGDAVAEIEGPIVVVGHSAGGATIARSARRAGQRWNSVGPAGQSRTCPALTSSARRTGPYHPRHS